MPQTVAVYLVAAWAAIEFADVVVPNLNGPQWVVTAVIVAALAGLPVVLVLAWVFDWGPEGLHRTAPEDAPDDGAAPSAGVGRRSSSSPWIPAVAVLVVGIGSALAVAALLAGGGGTDGGGNEVPPEPSAPALVPGGFAGEDSVRRRVLEDMGEVGGIPDLEGLMGFETLEALRGMDTLDVSELTAVAREVAEAAGISILIQQPREWRIGERVPTSLVRGDTLVVRGLAWDTAGVTEVRVDGTVVARSDQPDETLRFTAEVVGTGVVGLRPVVIALRTADGREIERTFRVVQSSRRPEGRAGEGGGS